MTHISIIGECPRIRFGLDQLDQAAELRLEVLNLEDAGARGVFEGDSPPPQGYQLRREGEGWRLAGDSAGCMYGLLDIAEAQRSGSAWPEGLRAPKVAERGIKFNIPLDARTPSYTDAGDSAWHNIPHMWEMGFWQRYLDDLALNKYNMLSLWSLHPFPSLVRVPGYERVALSDVKRTRSTVTGATTTGHGMYGARFAKDLETLKVMSIDDKIAFWRQVMAYADQRGISVYLFTWNVFVYGTEGSGYGITTELDNPVTKDYFRKSVAALIRTYPLLRGIGITAGERMSVGWTQTPDPAGDVQWLADTYGRGAADALKGSDRPFRIIHRQHFSGAEEILKAFRDIPVELDFSFKYSQAHMYSDTRPQFGKAFFAAHPKDRKTYLTVRNDDLYMLRWGGVGYAREYLEHMPHHLMRGLYMGSDGYTWGLDYLSKASAEPRRSVIDRQWYMMAIWGRLAYQPDLPEDYFMRLLASRLGCSDELAEALYALMERVSLVIPLINRAHWHDFDFQNYPEANCSVSSHGRIAHMGGELQFHDVHDYILTPAQPGTRYQGINDFCLRERANTPAEDMIPPTAVADELLDIADTALAQTEALPEAQGEAAAMIADCRGMALLARFFGHKLWAAVYTQRAVLRGIPSPHAARAIAHAREAHAAWIAYTTHISQYYLPQRLGRMNGRLVSPELMIPQSELDLQMVEHLMQEYEELEQA